MCVGVCVWCVCVGVCRCVCEGGCRRVCRVYVGVYVCVCRCVYRGVCMSVCVWVCMCGCGYVCIYVWVWDMYVCMVSAFNVASLPQATEVEIRKNPGGVGRWSFGGQGAAPLWGLRIFPHCLRIVCDL